ncbi:hypothetical protein ACIP2X_31705 [Streptomyces sp. NPDC089424]|uniref:hypothetical protein n=1 Tax=Streptomyces sp. NPDC089424 TaxID=3365917 RepID=UPI003821E757
MSSPWPPASPLPTPEEDADGLQDAALTRSVLKAAVADPQRLPETLASYAVRQMGPAAARAVTMTRAAHPGAGLAELQDVLLTRGKRRVVSEGALIGGPLMIMAPFAFCAALLSQARICLELTALAGQDPTAPVRSAELLVLQGVYPDVDRARAALAEAALAEQGKAGKKPLRAVEAGPHRGRTATLFELTLRMARVLGLIAPKEQARVKAGRVRRRLAAAGGYVLLVAVFLVGLVAPFVWMPYLGRSYSRATDGLLDRALALYFGEPAARRRRTRGAPGMAAAMAKALLSLLVPVVLVAVIVLADLRVADSRWPVLAVTLLTASCGVAAVWQWRRRRRHRNPAH